MTASGTAAAIADAEGRLRAALLAGGGTAPLHATLAELRERLEREERIAEERQAAARTADAEAHERRVSGIAARIAGECEGRFKALMARLALPAPPPSRSSFQDGTANQENTTMIDNTAVDLDPAVAAAATALAKAEEAADRATAAARAAEDAAAGARAKLRQLDAERAGVVERRARGEKLPDDGPVLALLSADRDALASVVGQLDAVAFEATAEAKRAVSAFNAAAAALRRAEDTAEARALEAHLVALDERTLREAVLRANEVARRLGRSRPAWTPSRETMELLLPLHHGRPWL